MKSKENKPKTKNKMTDLSPNILIITLHVSGLSTTIKRQRLAECIYKHDPTKSYPKKLTS